MTDHLSTIRQSARILPHDSDLRSVCRRCRILAACDTLEAELAKWRDAYSEAAPMIDEAHAARRKAEAELTEAREETKRVIREGGVVVTRLRKRAEQAEAERLTPEEAREILHLLIDSDTLEGVRAKLERIADD